MKSFLILFKTGSIPFSSTKQNLYKEDWNNYIKKLKILKKLKEYSFFKKEGVFISEEKIKLKHYIPHKDIFSGYFIIISNNTKEAIDTCKECPVFKRNGSIQIKEIDRSYLDNIL